MVEESLPTPSHVCCATRCLHSATRRPYRSPNGGGHSSSSWYAQRYGQHVQAQHRACTQVAPKFKGKPPASCPHNFLVHICQEHEDVGDVERVVRGLADRSVSARDYRKHVPPGSKPTAQSAQDESDAPSLAPSDSKTVTGSSFIRQQVCIVVCLSFDLYRRVCPGHGGFRHILQCSWSSARGQWATGRGRRHGRGKCLAGARQRGSIRSRQQCGKQRCGGQ